MSKQIAKAAGDIKLAGATLTATGIVFDGEMSFDEWMGVGQFIERANGAIQWWAGDWLNYGEGKLGDRYEQGEAIFNVSYGVLRDWKWVAGRFELSCRHDNLSWTHHREVAGESPSSREELLANAEPMEPDKPPTLTAPELRKEVKRRRQERETPALPTGKYRVLYADPPWEYDDERGDVTGNAASQYPVMAVECICGLFKGGRSVQGLSAKDAALFLWATAPMLPEAMRVMAAWGFQYKAQFAWDKVRPYFGHYNCVGHELLLLGIKGDCQPAKTGELENSVVRIEKSAHSAKPDRFYEIIETMYPLPDNGKATHVELFARKARPGWDSWGHEAPTTNNS